MGEKGEKRPNSPKMDIDGSKKWAKKPKNVQTRPKWTLSEGRNGRKSRKMSKLAQSERCRKEEMGEKG